MSPSNHTYGPTCRLSRVVDFSGSKANDDIPSLKSQYFYSSQLPIDDPLTAVPTPSGADSKQTKYSPRPFSPYDNSALEEAWLGLGSERDRKNHRKLKNAPLKLLLEARTEIRASSGIEVAAQRKREVEEQQDKKGGKSKNKQSIVGDQYAKDKAINCSKCHKSATSCTCSIPKLGCGTCPSQLVSASKDTAADSIGANSKPARSKHINVAEGHSSRSVSSVKKPAGDASKGHTGEGSVNENPGAVAVPRNQVEAGSSPYNLHCQDRIMNFSTSPCCSDLEKKVNSEPRTNISEAPDGGDAEDRLNSMNTSEDNRLKNGRTAQVVDGTMQLAGERKTHELGPGQSDATTDTPRPSKENSAATSATVMEVKSDGGQLKEMQSTEHKAFEKQKQSKGRKDHKEHLGSHSTILSTGSTSNDGNQNTLSAPGSLGAGTTGSPFVRAPLRKASPSSRSSSPSISAREGSQIEAGVTESSDDNPSQSPTRSPDRLNSVHPHRCKAHKNTRDYAKVPVGISRLHLVNLPALQMMPIYWSPVHDIATVTRGTWFYKDTMYPVEPTLANQLEIGFRELRPWSQTWKDELSSAIEVGAAGEEKISHRIWPRETEQALASDPFCAARCFHGDVAAIGTVDLDEREDKTLEPAQVPKRFPNSHVIYKDSQNAFILKPSLLPSEYYGRRPLAKIRRGTTVGIHVVRGFDWKLWGKVHSSPKSSMVVKAEQGASVAGSADAAKRTACSACLDQEKRPKVTDLVLVIHGIGQKLSERVESFHFTHAINAFRRSVNVELGTDTVRTVLREDLGGVMVLPVNWRSNLSFVDGGPMTDGDKPKDPDTSDFSLKDITPDTIPAVRNLISDVMLDIPFYMSHHKPKMIEALVKEANRVYRLWCQNNTEFHSQGRVHIIAHSLGSAMALDVLSNQPTSNDHINLRSKKPSTKYFEFDTKNLFFAGSPAGFFLLLHKGKLIPRKGRNKPGAEKGDDTDKGIAGDAGTFGCLAVDNLYNVVHYNDPIAYRLNAAVDPLYSATLKNAQVPNATTGWIEALGNAMKSITPGATATPELGVGQIAKPSVPRLPSQLEMEVHDFSREEIAEKKFYLLNDNGQIDYFLSSGGGPLEIQYLNMLSAHSSYWGSPDFVRMLVTEVGRKPGRSNTLPNMKAAKVGHK